MSNIMSNLHAVGLNPFAVTLVAESLLKSPLAPLTIGKPQGFFFPVRRGDCAAYSGVRFTLEAVPTDQAAKALTTDLEQDEEVPLDHATEINRLRNVIQAACSGGLFHMIERWKQLFPDAPVPSLHMPLLTQAAQDVLAERQRQISTEGWTPEHDDEHADGSMSRAAGCYAIHRDDPGLKGAPAWWPWHAAWWKPADPRRNLVKAGALILAELERLDRAERPQAIAGMRVQERKDMAATEVRMVSQDGVTVAHMTSITPDPRCQPLCRDCADFGPVCPNSGKRCGFEEQP